MVGKEGEKGYRSGDEAIQARLAKGIGIFPTELWSNNPKLVFKLEKDELIGFNWLEMNIEGGLVELGVLRPTSGLKYHCLPDLKPYTVSYQGEDGFTHIGNTIYELGVIQSERGDRIAFVLF